jgi:hypothetical protein
MPPKKKPPSKSKKEIPKTVPQINSPPIPLQKWEKKEKKITHHHPKKQYLGKKN